MMEDNSMKKHLFTSCTALLAVAALCGCSAADDGELSAGMEWHVTAHATKEGGDIVTRALFIGGNSGSRYYSLWDTGDEAVVYKAGTNVGTMKPTRVGDPTSDLKGTLTGSFAQGDELTVYTPNTAFDYTGQKGTIGDVSSNHAYMETTTHVASVNGTDVYTDEMTFHSSQAYLIFHFQDSEGKRLHVKQLTISAASGQLVQQKPLNGTAVYGDLVVETEKVDGEYPSELFVALHNDSGEADTYSFSVVTPERTYESEGNAQKVVNATLVDGGCYRVVRTLTLTSPQVRLMTSITPHGNGGGDDNGSVEF